MSNMSTKNSSTYTTSVITTMGPDGKPKIAKTEGYNIQKPKQSKPKIVYKEKFADSHFNFQNSTINNAAINTEGPVNFNTKNEHYEKGAQKQQFDISGGDFTQANLGGDAKYDNKGSVISATKGRYNGVMKVTGRRAFYCSFKSPATFMYASNAGDQAVNRTHVADYTNQRVVPLGHVDDNAGGGGGVGSRGDWSYDVNKAVLEILKSDVTPTDLYAALTKGKKIKELWEYVKKCKENKLDVVFDSFLNYEDDEEMDTGS